MSRELAENPQNTVSNPNSPSTVHNCMNTMPAQASLPNLLPQYLKNK